MKMLLVALSVVMSVSAFAQKHMVEFNTESLVGSFNYIGSKVSTQDSTEDKELSLGGSYAYALTGHLQVAGRAFYGMGYNGSDPSEARSSERYMAQVGAIYNLNSDFRNSYYASVYVGMDWDRAGTTTNETMLSSVAIGRRMPLSMFGLENVSYSPEISYSVANPTKSNDLQWANDLAIKFLQFSVFF